MTWLQSVLTRIDADWLDLAAMLCGLANVVFQKFKQNLSWRDGSKLYAAAADGVALPPILVLIAGAFASTLITYLEHASRVTLFLAGCTALWALIEEDPKGGATVRVRHWR